MSAAVSAIGNALGLNPAAPVDEISIVVGNTRVVGWESIAVTLSAEHAPNSFTLTASDQYPSDPARATIFPSGPGQRCQVFAGNDLLITGYVDQYGTNIGQGHHDVTITGRGLCEDLVDCAADLLNTPELRGATVNAANTRDLAQKLCKPFGITVRSAVADLGKPILPFSVAVGETSWEIIERVCRYAGYLAFEDELGTLVLDRVGTKAMASGFTMPGNIESASSTLSINQRFTSYTAVWSTINNYLENSPISLQVVTVPDDTMPKGRYRPRIIHSEQSDPSFDLAKARANWEKARRIGRSQAINLTTSDWRDSAGQLWRPNMLASIYAPALKLINVQWIIASVVFRKDQSGRHADIVMMPKDAFTPEPSPLFLWDREMMHSVGTGGAAAPATAPPALTGASGLHGGGV
jgi:prophage tail gpP-like protein